MLKFCLGALAGMSLLVVASTASWATPSTILYIPSTDVQAPDTNHLGFDGYASYNNPKSGTISDFGYTRGFKGRFELGIDLIGSQPDPWLANAKWQLLEPKGKRPALAIGAYNWGGKKNVLAGNLLYALVSETFGNAGRFSIGYQHAQKSRVGRDEDMLMLAWEKQVTPKWWAAVDFSSGKNAFGAITPGVAYTFSPNTSMILGYNFYNNGDFKDTIEVNVDINF